MTLTKPAHHLLDVNVLVALLDEDHIHHAIATNWFRSPRLRWAICPLTEAGFLRHAARPQTKGASLRDAAKALERLAQEPGYSYQPLDTEWKTLTAPFADRIFGHKQITDAYLLGLAIQNNLVLVTLDRAILHLAGKHLLHVLLLEA